MTGAKCLQCWWVILYLLSCEYDITGVAAGGGCPHRERGSRGCLLECYGTTSVGLFFLATSLPYSVESKDVE